MPDGTNINNSKGGFCDCLPHPFQNDPGVSQTQRVMDDLLAGDAKIDARTTADLLLYFYQLSRNFNYYDADKNITDWQGFFEDSVPFTIASLIKYNAAPVSEKFNFYAGLFNSKPGISGLQLSMFYTYYNGLKRINDWYSKLKDHDLPIQRTMENIIKDRLSVSLSQFVSANWLAAKYFKVRKIDFSAFEVNAIWKMPTGKTLIDLLNTADAAFTIHGHRQRLIELHNTTADLFSSVTEATGVLGNVAEDSLQQSLYPLKADLQKKHAPHLALLFSFLRIFERSQGDLNSLSKKHLDFFYKEVLRLKSAPAVADSAFIIFDLRKDLDTYPLKKDLAIKGGKDLNKQDILFALDDEIVVNKAQVKDIRTLFSNNQVIPNAAGGTKPLILTEGIYMAPDATKADGIAMDFQTDEKNFYTLGNKESKYTIPGTNSFQSYPNARLGLILASPVLLLNEGTRTVTITLSCKLDGSICGGTTSGLYDRINDALNATYYYVSESLIAQLIKKGISDKVVGVLRGYLTSSNAVGADSGQPGSYCYSPQTTQQFDIVVPSDTFEKDIDITIPSVAELFPKRKPFSVLFSGDKEWIKPNAPVLPSFSLSSLDADGKFSLTIVATLGPDLDAVTFYNIANLKEDFNTVLPLVKIELDDHYKINYTTQGAGTACCLEKAPPADQDVSLYQFFRTVVLEKDSTIHVHVCGVKKLVIQNDESLLDVNSPFPPFGTRPEIVDFEITTPTVVITAELLTDAGVSQETIDKLTKLIEKTADKKLRVARNALPTFLRNNGISDEDQVKIADRLDDPKQNYSGANLIGPNFYLGSKEVFCKKWDEIYINLNWKDKPGDFRNYYKGYIMKEVPLNSKNFVYGLDEAGFQVNLSILHGGDWAPENLHNGSADKTELNPITNGNNRKLFSSFTPNECYPANPLPPLRPFQQNIHLKRDYFPVTPNFELDASPLVKYEPASRNGFMKINLQNQDFLHKDYPYVLARQMMALGNLAAKSNSQDNKSGGQNLLDDAVYYKGDGDITVFNSAAFQDQLKNLTPLAQTVDSEVNDIKDILEPPDNGDSKKCRERLDQIQEIVDPKMAGGLSADAHNLYNALKQIDPGDEANKTKQAIIPLPPWTPVISNLTIDYSATATATDISLIHLYPYTGTYKQEEILLEPTLFPSFCDEGTLYIGIENLVPGSNLNILFQLAEATADSELDPETVDWYYLDNNTWKPLREGFEILDDATGDLTSSGIIKFALPEDITNQNTVLPKGLYWIKAALPQNSKAVSETVGIATQAIRATFTNDASNDTSRLAAPIAADQLTKLEVADASVKSVSQPYPSFDGAVPEDQGKFYVRVSELLRHKGRAIQKFDYERIILEAFPEVFKAKCITHSFALNAHLYKNDFPYAPGYIILAVIPDLFKLKGGNSVGPKLPVSILEKIEAHVRKCTSPFVRFRAMNPRYEKVSLCLKVKLLPGKDEIYYKEKLREDLGDFIAPWTVGDYYSYKLSFGQPVNRSVIIGFLERLDYIDFILYLNMLHQDDATFEQDESKIPDQIYPKTPRSILVAGDIDISIDPNACPDWEYCPGQDASAPKKSCCGNEVEKFNL